MSEEIELKNPCLDCCERLICSVGGDPDYLLCEKLNLYHSYLIPFNKLKAEIKQWQDRCCDEARRHLDHSNKFNKEIWELQKEISQLKADKKQMINKLMICKISEILSDDSCPKEEGSDSLYDYSKCPSGKDCQECRTDRIVSLLKGE